MERNPFLQGDSCCSTIIMPQRLLVYSCLLSRVHYPRVRILYQVCSHQPENIVYFYWLAIMANPVGIWVSFRRFLLGCRMAIQVGKLVDFSVSFLFSVLVKVLPVTPLVSGVFVHRAFCAYFLRIERVVELRRFLWWTQ